MTPDQILALLLLYVGIVIVVVACTVCFLLSRMEDRIMSQFEELAPLIAALNDSTNLVALRIQTLLDQIAAGMTLEQVTAVKAGLQAEIDRLNALCADPEVPIP